MSLEPTREPLRFGIIGLGKMGGIRARTLRENEGARLVSVTDPKVPASGYEDAQFHADAATLIASELDAIFVCTPNRFAPELVEAALDAGKHVFCEKPAGRNMDDVERILAAEKRNPGKILKFGFNHRHHFGISEARKLVDSGKYGRILWLRGIYGKGESTPNVEEWRSDPEMAGGGILLDQGSHMLDLFRYFCGDFVEIKSMVTRAYWDFPMEDNAFALLRDEQGRVAMLHSSFNQWKHRFTLEIYLSGGYVIVDGMPSSTRSYRDEWITHAPRTGGHAIGNPPEESIFCNTDPSWQLELAEFVESVRTGQPVPHGSSNDAREAMRMVHAIYDADDSFRPGA